MPPPPPPPSMPDGATIMLPPPSQQQQQQVQPLVRALPPRALMRGSCLGVDRGVV
jgi:hypothetical protein